MIPDRTEFHWDVRTLAYIVHRVKDGVVTSKLSIPHEYPSRIPKIDTRKERHVQNRSD